MTYTKEPPKICQKFCYTELSANGSVDYSSHKPYVHIFVFELDNPAEA